jgi:DNA polymerase-4
VLAGRFEAYRDSSRAVMSVLAAHSGTVEPVSLDEAFLVIAPGSNPAQVVDSIRREIAAATGLTASVGVGESKLVAKIASDDAKPDGWLVVPGEQVQAFLDPLPVRRLPGVGPASQSRLARLGISTVRQLRAMDLPELTGLLGDAHGSTVWHLAHGRDDRPVVAEHETKSVSVEETFDIDLTDPVLVATVVARMAGQVTHRMRGSGLSGRTVTLKARYPDFTTVTRSATRSGPTDDERTVAQMAQALMAEVDLPRGVRLLGVGCSGLTTWVQDDLFTRTEEQDATIGDDGTADRAGDGSGDVVSDGDGSLHGPPRGAQQPAEAAPARPRWRSGQDVEHVDHGRGWVWGSGAGVVTVRFEQRHTAPGPVRSFAVDDPALRLVPPEPLDAAD